MVGFKSFCEKTQITFSGSGLTCIIGPNGCGKSNIVDAISWVLGEQSHKSLRAERMSDCIFNGTAKRPPMGLSEVTLTLVDPELAEAAAFVLGGEDNPTAAGPVAVPDSAFGATTAASPRHRGAPYHGRDRTAGRDIRSLPSEENSGACIDRRRRFE